MSAYHVRLLLYPPALTEKATSVFFKQTIQNFKGSRQFLEVKNLFLISDYISPPKVKIDILEFLILFSSILKRVWGNILPLVIRFHRKDLCSLSKLPGSPSKGR